MGDELAAANRRVNELEDEVNDLNSQVEELLDEIPDGMERCPACDESLGLTDNLPDNKRFNCPGRGAAPF